MTAVEDESTRPAAVWVCPVNPDWCGNFGCHGDECVENPSREIAGTLSRDFSARTDKGVAFPAASVGRRFGDDVDGIYLHVTDPRKSTTVQIDMTPSEARLLVAQLTAKLDLL